MTPTSTFFGQTSFQFQHADRFGHYYEALFNNGTLGSRSVLKLPLLPRSRTIISPSYYPYTPAQHSCPWFACSLNHNAVFFEASLQTPNNGNSLR